MSAIPINMKSYIITFMLAILCFFTQETRGQQFVSYEATVHYSSTTGQKSTYKLNVTVSNDAVTTIHFNNNGSVHTGYNNEGYIYTGGSLTFSRDYNSKITGASTIVKIKYSNGAVQQFKVEL